MQHLFFLALVDTGSNHNILGSNGLEILSKLKIPIDYDNLIHVATADGQLQKVFGSVTISSTLRDSTKNVNFLVIPSLNHEIILGMDFLQLFEITLNLSNFSFSQAASLCAIHSLQGLADLTPEQSTELNRVINLFKNIAPTDRIGRTSLITHTINTGNASPINQKQYPLSPAMQNHLNKEIDVMLKQGVIQPSQSPWCSPLWLVTKSSGEYRTCFDGRKLNQITVADAYPMPNIDTILSKLRDAKYLSSIDLRHAFFQVPLDESSKPKTAFAISGKGLFEFNVMPFGLLNSPKTMVRLMDQVLGPSLEPFVFSYLDDIIIATSDFDTHLAVLQTVYIRLKDAGLTINLSKCEFCRSSLTFLGYVVDKQGLQTNPDKITAIENFPVPTTTTEIKRFLGLVGWYRRFIKDFSTLAAPINSLLHGRKKGQPIVWNAEADEAFGKLKLCLISAPVLASPDFSKTFHIQCDASNVGVGAVLYQEEDGLEHPIAYISKTLTRCQQKYTVTELELYSVIVALEKFRSYVEGTHFVIHTDHSSLKWLHSLSNPSGRLARWAIQISKYDCEIVHRKGSANVVADALSRGPVSVAVLDLSSLKPDAWYTDMLAEVQNNPLKYPTFKVSNGTLYKHVFSKISLDSNTTDWKIVVPTPNRTEILHLCHDVPTAGHLGITKTLYRISELYYWPGMRSDVRRYVQRCSICAACKSSNLPQAGQMGQYRNIHFSFQLISMDLLGPYPRSKNGNQYVLVVVDWFTKFVLVHPMPKATSKNIIKFLENQVFLLFGVPQICACDNGPQFISSEFKQFMSKFKIQKIWYNARYHPQINHTERVNKVITTALRSYIQGNQKTWDTSLHEVAQAIRTAQHDVTEHPPSFLVFGRNVPLSGDYYGKIAENAENVVEISDKLQRLEDIQTLPIIFEDVRRRLKHAYENSKTQYDLGKRNNIYRVGDRVWKKNLTLSNAAEGYNAKLAPKFIPCTVTKVLSNLVYQLSDSSGKDLGNWHIKNLKPDITVSPIDSVPSSPILI